MSDTLSLENTIHLPLVTLSVPKLSLRAWVRSKLVQLRFALRVSEYK